MSSARMPTVRIPSIANPGRRPARRTPRANGPRGWLALLLAVGGLGCLGSEEPTPAPSNPPVVATADAGAADSAPAQGWKDAGVDRLPVDSPALADSATSDAAIEAPAADLVAIDAEPGPDAPPGPGYVACNSNLAAIANPPDFSLNGETGAMDPHTLEMRTGDVQRGTDRYVTRSAGNHEHELIFTFEQRRMLMHGQSVTVTTNGAPLNAAIGHRHTVVVRSCFAKK